MTFLKPHEILLKKAETDLQGAEVLYKSDNEFLDVEIVFFLCYSETQARSVDRLIKNIRIGK